MLFELRFFCYVQESNIAFYYTDVVGWMLVGAFGL